jgi:hypothetical protein
MDRSSLVAAAAAQAPWWPPVAVACMALLFTVASFWWINARQGRLKCFEPHSFAAALRPGLGLLRLPLALYNTGAKPIIVQDLRLRFPDEQRDILGLPWRSTRTRVDPRQDDVEGLPAVFSLAGRTAATMFVEFGGPFPGIEFTPEAQRVRIEARLGHKRGWHEVLEFRLLLSNVRNHGSYIAYSNKEDALSKEERAKTVAALNQLVGHLQGVADAVPEEPRD